MREAGGNVRQFRSALARNPSAQEQRVESVWSPTHCMLSLQSDMSEHVSPSPLPNTTQRNVTVRPVVTLGMTSQYNVQYIKNNLKNVNGKRSFQ